MNSPLPGWKMIYPHCNDININAPRLYTDTYYMKYLINMAEAGMGA